MKRILVIVAAAFLYAISLNAQEMETKESIAYLNGGGYIGSHNNIGAWMGLEYDRQLNGNWFWGARLSGTYCFGYAEFYDWSGYGKNPYRNSVKQNIYKTDGMLYYRLPVIRDIVKLRAGAGLGLGYHNIIDKNFYGPDKVIPYANACLNWIVRCGSHLEFVFSPAIAICPSEFDYSVVQLGGYTDINPWLMTYYGLSLGIGYRF